MIQVSNSGDELDRSSGISAPKFTIACVADNSKEEEEEEEEIPLKRKKGLCELLTSKAKGVGAQRRLGVSAPSYSSSSSSSFGQPLRVSKP